MTAERRRREEYMTVAECDTFRDTMFRGLPTWKGISTVFGSVFVIVIIAAVGWALAKNTEDGRQTAVQEAHTNNFTRIERSLDRIDDNMTKIEEYLRHRP